MESAIDCMQHSICHHMMHFIISLARKHEGVTERRRRFMGLPQDLQSIYHRICQVFF